MKLTRIVRTALAVTVVGAIVASGIALAQDDEPLYLHRAERLAELVEDGVITQEQADAVLEGLETDARVLGTVGRGPGYGLVAAAEVLGMEVDELRALLLEGATLAEIAGDQVDEVVDALVADRTERIEAAVDAGRLTRDEADERLAELEEHITDFVNSPFEPQQHRHGRRAGPGFGPGSPGFGPGDCEPNLFGAAA